MSARAKSHELMTRQGRPASAPASVRVRQPRARPRALVVLLHGGKAHSMYPTRPWDGAVLRMMLVARALRRSGAGQGLVVARVRYRLRGWNGHLQSPVADARSALARLATRYPQLPIALVGHSMGGRVALAVADAPGVRSVVALAPWIEPGDPAQPLTSRSLLIVHGALDRITDPAASAAFADRAREFAADVAYISMSDSGHTMLRRARLWHDLIARYVVATVAADGQSVGGDGVAARLVRRALAGDEPLTV